MVIYIKNIIKIYNHEIEINFYGGYVSINTIHYTIHTIFNTMCPIPLQINIK
jgi:hypothetical protein